MFLCPVGAGWTVWMQEKPTPALCGFGLFKLHCTHYQLCGCGTWAMGYWKLYPLLPIAEHEGGIFSAWLPSTLPGRKPQSLSFQAKLVAHFCLCSSGLRCTEFRLSLPESTFTAKGQTTKHKKRRGQNSTRNGLHSVWKAGKCRCFTSWENLGHRRSGNIQVTARRFTKVELDALLQSGTFEDSKKALASDIIWESVPIAWSAIPPQSRNDSLIQLRKHTNIYQILLQLTYSRQNLTDMYLFSTGQSF